MERSVGQLPAVDVAASVHVRFRAEAARPPGEAVEVYPGVLAWRDGRRLVLADDALAVCGGVDGPDVWLAPASGTGAGPDLHRALPVLLAPALLACGVHLVHGGVVAGDDGAFVVLGPSGAGKSTSIVAAHAAGLRILGDDLFLLWADDGRWWVQGVPRPIQVPVELDPAGGAGLAVDRRGRISPPGWLAPDRAPLLGVVLPRHDAGEGYRVPADAGVVGRQVVAGSFAALAPALVPEVLALAGAVCSLPLWALGLAADPTRRVELAAGHLAELVA